MRAFSWHRTHAGDPSSPGPPHAWRAAAPYAAILAWSGVLGAAHTIAPRTAAALAVTAAAAGVAAWTWTALRSAGLRDDADRFIATAAGAPPPAALLERRRAELVRPRERRMLATGLRRVIASAQRPPLRSARVPVDRLAVCAERERIEALAAALADPDAPVPACAVARVRLLLTDARGPLYRRPADTPDALHRQLVQTLHEIERNVHADERR
jgi:hypothetical protein